MLARKFKGPDEKVDVGTGRIEALGDGVFAIVMTLLVLELKLPDFEDGMSNARFWAYVHDLLPSLLSFLLSFVILGILWFGHRLQYIYIARTNRTLMWLDILFYLCICIVPFTAGMLGRYPENQLVELAYGSNLIVAIGFLFGHWHYGINHKGLRDREIPKDLRNDIRMLFLAAPALYVVAIVISFIDPMWSFYAYLATPVFYFLPTKLDKYLP